MMLLPSENLCALQLENEGGAAGLEEAEYKPKQLLPFMKRIPARRLVHLPEQAADPLSFTLSYNSSYPLPSGIASPVLAQYDITGVCNSLRLAALPYYDITPNVISPLHPL